MEPRTITTPTGPITLRLTRESDFDQLIALDKPCFPTVAHASLTRSD